MRKLVVSMNVTLDGYMSGANCELDWHFKYWDESMGEALTAELYKADTILFGRKTYCGMMRHWEYLSAQKSLPHSDLAFFSGIAETKKVVYSNTLTSTPWKNSSLIKGDLKSKLLNLKKAKGKNIIVLGSGQLVRMLVLLNLVDEFQLWLHPVLIGSGKLLFADVHGMRELKLKSSRNFRNGVVWLCYSK